MDSTLTTTPAPVTTSRRRAYVVGGLTTAVAVGGTLWAVLKAGTTGNSDLSSLAYVAAAALIVGVVLFVWLVPARITAGGSGLPFALVSVPLIYAFWSGLPLLVGVAAIQVATAHRSSGGAKRGRALAAIIIGAVTAILTIAGILVG
jgi:hypothetical protein